MTAHTVVIFMLISGIGNLAIGFLMGKYHERWNWNILITEGKIPAPRN